MPKLLTLMILAATCAAAQTVEGSVYDAATGAGIGGIKVQLERGYLSFYDTTTDAKGRFRIDNVLENDYAIRYVSPSYWQTAGSTDNRLYHVAAGNPIQLEARLIPWSKISGRVVDGRGNGIANARLELSGSGLTINGRTYLRTSWGGGGGGALSEGPLAMAMSGATDANGKFEVQVMPGAYGLSAAPPPDLKPPDPGEDGLALAWKRTYYPNSAIPDAASKIVVLPGGDVSGIELKLLAGPSHAVRGVLLNPDGTPAPKVAITLGQTMPGVKVESSPDGTFEFPTVPEGESRFEAKAQKDAVKLRATEWIEVGKHDVENLKLRLTPPLTLRVAVSIQALKEIPAPRLGPVTLSLRGPRSQGEDELRSALGIPLALPGPKGGLGFQDAYPGTYRAGPLVAQPPPPYYLDAILLGAADLTLQDVEISLDSTLTIVYKTDGGSVRGKVENCALGGVVLVPSDPLRRQHLFTKSAPCDATGNYEIVAVRPGDYYALAFAGNGPVLKFDDVLLNQGVKVSVRPGEAATADLRTITKPVF